MRPKYKTGDRLIRKNNPEYVRIVRGLLVRTYRTDVYINGEFTEKHIINFKDMEENYTLDLNHYIKSL